MSLTRRRAAAGTRGLRRPEERLARLIEAAGASFAANGYAGTRVQAVCRSAGVSVGTFYQHFEDKAELLAHLIDLAAEEVPVPELDVLSHFERQMAAYVRAPRAKLWSAWREALLAEPRLRDHGIRVRAMLQQRLINAVREARAARPAQDWAVDEATAAWLALAAIRELIIIDGSAPLSHTTSVVRALWHVMVGLRAAR
jgi:AcrR family transcriptional regulator